ncbi:uncharacterized protein LOC134261354 isoform X3 [Saccostrea cucullata]|uniref:uncharacterized protein LOC134261354 isoform X3 n=1 Tax=Saccostrea cuccullata TaxID=36930 RepID=UPI002ED3E468
MASRTDAGIFTEMFFLLIAVHFIVTTGMLHGNDGSDFLFPVPIADISLQNELLGERPIDSLPLESNSQDVGMGWSHDQLP